ncbi:MAG: tat pathway signal sequence [Segniliparus sp.]|uniref:tat pathway signal sequence n=1 Tax=Segniliparus sp. TaxID=2804064 RepID=UPI003F37463D
MPRLSSARRSAGLAFAGLAVLTMGSSPNAAADDNAIGLDFFKNTKCSAWQIYHAMERVAPEEIAKIKSGPVGSRRQKWLLNWLIRTREATDAGSVIPAYENSTGGMFGDIDWRTRFLPYEQQISEDCSKENG